MNLKKILDECLGVYTTPNYIIDWMCPLTFQHNQELLYGWSLDWRPVSELE